MVATPTFKTTGYISSLALHQFTTADRRGRHLSQTQKNVVDICRRHRAEL